jgi:hypothetical protein
LIKIHEDTKLYELSKKHLLDGEVLVECFEKLEDDFICITNKRVIYSNTVYHDDSVFIVSYLLKSIIGASYGSTGEVFIITQNDNIEIEFRNNDTSEQFVKLLLINLI